MLLQRFQDLIHNDCLLIKNASYWQVIETSAGALNKKVEIGGCRSIGFTLDKDGVEPWGFIKSNTPLNGVRKVCDSIVVAHHNKKDYVVAMDLKSTRIGSAHKQIKSTKLLIEWIIGLLECHSHWGGDYEFVGVVNMVGRKQPRKGTSRRREIPDPDVYEGVKYFTLVDNKKVCLPDLIAKI